jgi:hypothetical protein
MASAINGRQTPNMQNLRQYSTYLPDAVEVIWQPLYDIQTYAAAGQASLSFFQVPNGQGGKTYADTNMEMTGQLPSGMNFLCTGLEIQLFPAGTIETTAANSFADDVYKILKQGSWLELSLLQKVYLREAPLMNFPPQTGLTGFAATNITSGTDGSLVEYARNCGATYQISPLRIPASQNFSVKIQWPAVQAISADAKIAVRLLGFTYRNAQ